MRKFWKYVLVFIIGATLGYQLMISFLPNLIYSIAQNKVTSNNKDLSINQMLHVPLPNAQSRAVVMPNPDFLYSVAYYDLSKGPLKLKGQLPDSTYWSVALYQPNTINWYIKNDLQYGSPELDLVIAGEHYESGGAEVAIAPEDKGFLLIRILVTDAEASNVAKFQAKQETIKLQPIK